jgi:hypothetical protein
MNNADMPAMPQPIAANENEFLDTKEYSEGNSGLTKREHFAGLAMQGLITLKGRDCSDTEITAMQCVRMADALLAQLDKGRG